MRILAIDPGKHVGWALWEDGKHYAGEASAEDLYEHVESWVAAADVVVCEGFKITGRRAKDSNQTIEMIGVLRYFCERAATAAEFVEQTPADASAFSTDAKLRQLGWWTTGSDHARSATRHLLLYLMRAALLDPATVLPSDVKEED